MRRLANSTYKILVLSLIYAITTIYILNSLKHGFYDAFFPTSCVSPSFIENSSAEVALHARMYLSHYPLSIIINLMLKETLDTSCWNMNMFLPLLPFVHLLFFRVLIIYFVQERKLGILLLVLYSIVLLIFLGSSVPLFYISLGDTVYLVSLYFLTVASERGLKTSDFFVAVMLFLLGMFSYYTFGFSMFTTLVISSFLLIAKRGYLSRMARQFTYFLAVISLVYLGFDYIFYQQLSTMEVTLYNLLPTLSASILRLVNIQSHEDSLIYTPPLDLIRLLYRLSTTLVLIFSLIFVLEYIIIFLKSDLIHDQQSKITTKIIVTSSIVSAYIVSINYTLMMQRIYLRYYIYFQLLAIIALIYKDIYKDYKKTLSRLLRFITPILAVLITIYGTVALVNIILNPSERSSQFINYLSEQEYPVICNYLKAISERTVVYAEYKIAYSLPLKCDNPKITTRVFKASYFSSLNNTHNMLYTADSGIVFYSQSYASYLISLHNWRIYKPFVMQSTFDGIILNSMSVKLFLRR